GGVRRSLRRQGRLRSRGVLLLRELYFHGPALFRGYFEHVTWLQSYHVREKQIGNLLDASVVRIHVIVEELAPIGNPFFQFRYPVLQLEKILVGLQVRVTLSDAEEFAQRTSHQEIGLRLLSDGCRIHRSCTRLGQRDQSLALMLHVAFHSLDQIRDFIVSLLQQDINVGPRAIIVIPQAYQFVVDDDGVNREPNHPQRDQQSHQDAHEISLFSVHIRVPSVFLAAKPIRDAKDLDFLTVHSQKQGWLRQPQ